MTLDCQKRGVCCVEQLILVSDGDTVPPWLVKDGFVRKQCGRRVALTGPVGIKTSCSIYPNRPTICRVMKPGVKECLVIRESCGLFDHSPSPVSP